MVTRIDTIKDLVVTGIWHSPGFGTLKHWARLRIGQGRELEFGTLKDLTATTIWHSPGFGTLKDLQ